MGHVSLNMSSPELNRVQRFITTTRNKLRRGGIGLMLRTALWSWVVTLGTLLIFTLAIIPHQERTFQQNPESKARSIVVSLRDLAAGAVVNEDFSSVVAHCNELLNGDPAVDYVIITKNNAYSIINQRSG